jgi:maltose O-acetyltransferase
VSPPGSTTKPGIARRVRDIAPDPDRALRQLGTSLRDDASMAWQDLVINRLGGSALLPRALRFLFLRLAGVRTATANIFPRVTFLNADVVVGSRSFINQLCVLEGPLTIGDDCQLGPRVMVLTSSHELFPDGSFAVRSRAAPVVIHDGCWIGAGAVVLPGTTIGAGCVIAAGAVVTKDCRPGGLYAGVPARWIRPLREEHHVVEFAG